METADAGAEPEDRTPVAEGRDHEVGEERAQIGGGDVESGPETDLAGAFVEVEEVFDEG